MGNIITDSDTGKNKFLNPFPGLRPFRPDESDLFFGRENESREVLSRLARNRFITVIGASGSGKSSLIYCGVIPGLESVGNKQGGGWKVLNMRPGNDPLGNLAETFVAATGTGDQSEQAEILESIRTGRTGLGTLIPMLKLGKDENLLLLIDQFEELFRYRGTRKEGLLPGESRKFVNLIVDAVNNKEGNIHVIITMRSDFIGECAHFQGLTELINNSNYLIPHMSADNYRQAIVGPVAYAGATIEEEMVDRLVNEIGEKTDQLPVLQHALMRTWDHWKRMGNTSKPIASTDYDSVGQMSEAMSRHANEAFEELDLRGREICETLYKTITEKGTDNRGIRHPTRATTIADIARCTTDELFRVVEIFRASGRSFVTPPPGIELTPDTIIDVSHESLMRVWDKLAEWVDEEAASVQMYLRLSEASELFQQGKTTLWRPPDLQLALNWRNENMPTLTWAERFNPAFERAMVYLRTSEKEYIAEEENKIRSQKRQLRRSRITAMILGTAAIISVFFMLFAFMKQIEAEKNRKEADEQRQLAVEQEQLAKDNAAEAERFAQEAEVQRNFALANADSARVNAAEANIQRQQAQANAARATLNAAEARRQEQEALRNAQIATENEKLANEERERATRLRMVSISKSMAVKSVQVIGQGDLQVLLAYQAYLFNRKNGGVANDADIYMGLYNVAKLFGGASYRSLEGHNGSVRSISFQPGESTFFTSGSDGKVIKWDINNPSAKQVVSEGAEIVEVLAVSPDGKVLACGSDNSVIRIIPLGGGVTYELAGHTNKIKSLAYSPAGNTLYSSGLDGILLKWNLETRQSTRITGNGEAIVSLDISASGKYMAGATSKGLISIWTLGGNDTPGQIDPKKGAINVVRFREGDLLAVGYTSGMVDLWDVTKGTRVAEIRSHSARVSDIRFNEKMKQMATCSMDGAVKIWNLNDLTEPPISLNDNDGFVLALAYSQDGKILVSGSDSQVSSLITRPVHVDYMIKDLCSILTRNFTDDEWRIYVGSDIEYQETCENQTLSIKVQEKKVE